MRAHQLPIQAPCFADWDAMASEAGAPTRFCEACQKHVHDLSAMTRRQAEALLEGAKTQDSSLCVRYRRDARGQIAFKHRVVALQAPLAQRQGVQQLLAAAALAVSAFLAPQAAMGDDASDIEEVLWKQERAAAQTLSPLGLDLEEESTAKDEDPFVPTAIPEPSPKHEPEMGKIMVY